MVSLSPLGEHQFQTVEPDPQDRITFLHEASDDATLVRQHVQPGLPVGSIGGHGSHGCIEPSVDGALRFESAGLVSRFGNDGGAFLY